MRDLNHISLWSDTLTFRINYQDTQPPARPQGSESQTSALDSDRDGSPGSDCKVMRYSSHSLAVLRSLTPKSLVLLLSPVLKPANQKRSRSKYGPADPFEDFGRELSKMHRRLRHVPYVPEVGMTETHTAFIEQAAAVIVVICESADVSAGRLDHQRSFADAVYVKGEHFTTVPFVLVRFDDDVATTDFDEDDYENVLHAESLTRTASTKAAQLLFKQETE